MELLQRRIPACYSLRQDLLVRIEKEVSGSKSKWVEAQLLNALDRQDNQQPGTRNEKTQHPSDEDFLRKIGKLWREDEQRGVDLMTKFKREHIVLTKEETDIFKQKLEPVIDKWVEDVKKEGIDGRKLVNKARKLIKKYEE